MANSSRDNILAGIKSALMQLPEQLPEKPDMVSPIYTDEGDADPALVFAENFKDRKGLFFYSQSLEEFRDQITAFVSERGFLNIHVWEKELADELSNCGFIFYE
jgi:L-lactate dehydrogenase complex protein LldG